MNAKNYLVTEQGIDASRITVVTNPMSGQTVQDYLVPAGADFSADVTGTTPVDETSNKPEARKPLPERRRSANKSPCTLIQWLAGPPHCEGGPGSPPGPAPEYKERNQRNYVPELIADRAGLQSGPGGPLRAC